MADKVHPDLLWDAEAKDAALLQAQQVSKRDPEAGALLIAQLIAVQKTEKEQGINDVTQMPNSYRPAKIYGFMARECHWTPQQMDSMHYLTFFAIVREVNARIQEENNAYRGNA